MNELGVQQVLWTNLALNNLTNEFGAEQSNERIRLWASLLNELGVEQA